jgi:hypothetical protein
MEVVADLTMGATGYGVDGGRVRVREGRSS